MLRAFRRRKKKRRWEARFEASRRLETIPVVVLITSRISRGKRDSRGSVNRPADSVSMICWQGVPSGRVLEQRALQRLYRLYSSNRAGAFPSQVPRDALFGAVRTAKNEGGVSTTRELFNDAVASPRTEQFYFELARLFDSCLSAALLTSFAYRRPLFGLSVCSFEVRGK